MALQTPRRRAWIAIGLLVALGALAAGAWGLERWRPLAHDTQVAVTWPKNIDELAQFVEDETDLRFQRDVHVEFLDSDAEYTTRIGADRTPTDEGRDLAATDEAVGRALGFWGGDVSLIDSSQTVRDASVPPAVWLDDENTVVVHARDGEDDLAPEVRADLVVLLTEVIDDQAYGVVDHLRDTKSAQEFQALAGLDIGQALWVRDRYVDQLDSDDATAYRRATSDQGDRYLGEVSSVPLTYRSLRIAAQTLGATYAAALHDSGRNAVRDAFTTRRPLALDQLSLPTAKYFHADTPERVAAPPAPRDATMLDVRQMGPFAVYLMVATGLTPPEALTASDGWGNDAFTAYRLGDRVCVDGRIIADSRADEDRLERGLDAWAGTRPQEAGALVARVGTELLLSVCDPGPKARQPVLGDAVVDQFFGRATLLRKRIELTNKPELAECTAVTFYERFTVAQMNSRDPSLDMAGELDTAASDCLGNV